MLSSCLSLVIRACEFGLGLVSSSNMLIGGTGGGGGAGAADVLVLDEGTDEAAGLTLVEKALEASNGDPLEFHDTPVV